MVGADQMSASETGSGWRVPSNVLVTGATGFVGTYLCRALAATGRNVTALALDTFSPESLFVLGDLAKKVKLVQVDLCDHGATRNLVEAVQPDAIIHTAAAVGLESSFEDPAFVYNVNINGTVGLLEAARKTRVRKFIYISSNSVYHLKKYEPIDELHPITSVSVGNPAAHYGASKMAAEQIGLVYATYHALDLIAVRIASVYGFGMHAPIYIKPMVEAAVAGEALVLQGGPMKRDYTYILDATAGIIGALDKDTRSIGQRVFNMSSGRTVTANELAAVVRGLVPSANIVITDELTEIEQRNILQRAPLSSEPAKKELGYDPRFTIETGVADYIEKLRMYRQVAG